MNTVLKGDVFEKRAFDLIQNAVNNLKLGLIPSCCTVREKPKYYAIGTDEYIEFDISIEVRIGEQKQLSFLYLIECKDYLTPIPVGKVEEFHSKVSQVSGVNVKGVFMSTSELQNRAFKFAKSKGMMWIKVARNDHEFMLYNSKRDEDFLTDTNFVDLKAELKHLKEIQSFMFSGNEDLKIDWDEMIFKFLKHAALGNLSGESTTDEPIIGLEKLSHRLIDQMSEKILNLFDPNILKFGLALNLDQFKIHLYDYYKLEICEMPLEDIKGRKIYGIYDSKNNKITIDSSIIGTDRYAFVVIHEIAHFFLHSNLQMEQSVYDSQSDSEYNSEIGKHELRNERHWMEWQANQLGACLLLPKISLMAQLIKTQRELGISKHGRIFCDNNGYNRNDFMQTMDALFNYFKASKTVIEYRMADIGIIKYAKDFRRPSTSFRGFAKQTKTLAQLIAKALTEMEFKSRE